jgi:RimJ/RimL family protein N-acetyltransferase
VRIELPSRLTDSRAALRPLRATDSAAYAEAFSVDRSLGRLLGVERDPDERAVVARINRLAQRAEEGGAAELAMADPATDAFWGAVTAHSFVWEHRRCELGFWVIAPVRGRGVGSSAVSLALSWLFGDLDLLRVEMTTTPENQVVPAFARRLGFRHEGTLRSRNIERGQRVDVIWFGLLREEWAGEPRS